MCVISLLRTFSTATGCAHHVHLRDASKNCPQAKLTPMAVTRIPLSDWECAQSRECQDTMEAGWRQQGRTKRSQNPKDKSFISKPCTTRKAISSQLGQARHVSVRELAKLTGRVVASPFYSLLSNEAVDVQSSSRMEWQS